MYIFFKIFYDKKTNEHRKARKDALIWITSKQFEVYDGYKYFIRRCIYYEL